ncbi:MAG: SDR family oxidoreductase [Candidatus Tectomicrobia bacterium]|uniref:SDR family oxidoreductase n=1 Tax=Tectimicrobiota bacterium TaxID=2528274 RepID=A0A933GLT8_UNCTE|nr:SDR family oxidoreductase [Candidatus Tectomicrobia bacterium]
MGLVDGKVAIVTGSGRGIGRADALILAREGASIVVNDLQEDVAMDVVETIKKNGGKATACVGSVTVPDFAEKVVKTAVNTFGKLDIIVNNAGYTWDAVIQNLTDEMWEAMMAVHVTAPFRIIRAATPYMREAAKKEIAEGKRIMRKIINISSMSGVAGNPGQANYSAAKMAVLGLTKTVAREWGRFNVCCNAIAYGFVETRLTDEKEKGLQAEVEGKKIALGIPKGMRDMAASVIPLGKGASTEEAAGPVLFLCSYLSDYVTGQCLLVNGGSYM